MGKKGLLCVFLVMSLLMNGISVLAEEQTGSDLVDSTEIDINEEQILAEEDVPDVEEKKSENSVKIWSGNHLTATPQNVQKLGEKIILKADVSGDLEGLSYKYVWMKDNWKKWGIIRDFGAENTVEFVPESAGDYKIYVDIKDQQGKIQTLCMDYIVMDSLWRYNGIVTDLKSPQEKYEGPVKISADITGETDDLRFKFVWAKTDWSQWGVLQDFNKASSVMWSPKEVGQYWLYVDVKDAGGKIQTKRIPFIISPVKWSFDSISFSSEEVKKGENLDVNVSVRDNTKGLRYKFVWMKDNWKEWGVIQELSEKQNATWKTPKKSGKYKIYVDIVDRDGVRITKDKDCTVLSQMWKQEELNINNGELGRIYTDIPIKANVSGEIEGLDYKFVWMKDNWKEWGVIKEFDNRNATVWYPKKSGRYQIYSDVRDQDGRVQTVTKEYVVHEAPWKVEKLKADGTGSYYVGDKTTITAQVSGETEGLQFKFVQRNGKDWSDWKVVKDFDTDNSAEVLIEKEGTTTIYVDVMDQRGVIFEPEVLTLTGNNLLSVKASETKTTIGKNVTFSPNFSGAVSGGEYKVVWMKDNWKEWGVIQDFAPNSQVTWTPGKEGQYHIYMDARLHGVTQSKSVAVEVGKFKNGWYYENGYKVYYTDGKKCEDVRNIIGRQESYEVKINKQMSCVTVYAKDGKNGYIIPVVAFACSPGEATPIGTFYTKEKYRWHHLFGADGQFCTRITENILFHSPPYSSFNNHTLWPKEYNKLGTWASSGCVRLRTGDAKWIYDNCSSGTKVVIYNSNVAGPFAKPIYKKIPLTQNWDPTDPYA